MTIQIPRLMTAASASALVAASAGFGAFYAWTTGCHHGPIIGGLSVLMALGLEGAKPFAIEGAVTALRSWSPIRAAALAALGTVAIAYSLTAELSLMAATRADASAKRTQDSDTAAAAKARYAATERELETLPVTRPVAALNAEIARLKTTPRLAPCYDTAAPGFGPTSRRVCAQIATLTAEAATTTRRAELQAALASAERDVAAAPLATEADPAAAALTAYLAVLGVPSEAETLSKWLALVPVLALEVGSALAAVLTGGTVTRRERPRSAAGAPSSATASDFGAEAISAPPETSTAQTPSTGGLKAALLEHLRERGGQLRTGQRSLAKALGASTTELHRALHALASTGAIVLSTAPTGTEVRIAS